MAELPVSPTAPRRPIYPPVYLLTSVVLMVALHLLAPVRQVVPAPWRYMGVILIVAGPWVVLWAAGIFRKAETTIKPFETSSTLVVRGPYRVSRNPIYLGMVVGLLGVGIVAGSITPFLVVPVFAYLIDRRFIRREEAMLAQVFGAQYESYKAAVRRWL